MDTFGRLYYQRFFVVILMSLYEQLVLDGLQQQINTQLKLQKLKNRYCQEYRIRSILDIDLIHAYRNLVKEERIKENRAFFEILKRRNVRTLSGVSVVTVLTKPFACPGKCIFCPTEPNMPKSYLSNEPAVMRAVMHRWDGLEQVHNRLKSLYITGHVNAKNELIISGGTWSFYPKRYQTAFIRSCYDGFNTFGQVEKNLEYKKDEPSRFRKFTKSGKTGKRSADLATAKKTNETALHRVIGLSIETRPDFITEEEVKRLRRLGCTRVQLGVQSLNDEVLDLNKRGHGIKEVREASKLLKDAGFKVDYHMMPNLLGSTPELDKAMFPELFANPDYQPDQLKIYPCSVVPYSMLERVHKKGEYRPYDEEELIDVLYQASRNIPPYVRVSRLIRDIPGTSILAGNTKTNLRQIVEDRMKRNNEQCRCIRCREVGNKALKNLKPELAVREYEASGGKEFFISFEDKEQDVLFGFCRLRIPSQFFEKQRHFIAEIEGCSLIRELHVYGTQVAIDEQEQAAVQHFGFGRKLMSKAEEIVVAQYGIKKMAVIAGVGVREYYKKLGYYLGKEYMIKEL